jgi:hypothetical protein
MDFPLAGNSRKGAKLIALTLHLLSAIMSWANAFGEEWGQVASLLENA